MKAASIETDALDVPATEKTGARAAVENPCRTDMSQTVTCYWQTALICALGLEQTAAPSPQK